jgi:hypothetical protein
MLYFSYDPNCRSDDRLLAEKRRAISEANREYARLGLRKRIRLTYKPELDPRNAWKYGKNGLKAIRLEDARRVNVYWSTRPVGRPKSGRRVVRQKSHSPKD